MSERSDIEALLAVRKLKDSERRSLKRCKPCPCGGASRGRGLMWGAAFILCPDCGRESDYDDPLGNAVRTWNKAITPKRA
jgi:hypothetical protein